MKNQKKVFKLKEFLKYLNAKIREEKELTNKDKSNIMVAYKFLLKLYDEKEKYEKFVVTYRGIKAYKERFCNEEQIIKKEETGSIREAIKKSQKQSQIQHSAKVEKKQENKYEVYDRMMDKHLIEEMFNEFVKLGGREHYVAIADLEKKFGPNSIRRLSDINIIVECKKGYVSMSEI